MGMRVDDGADAREDLGGALGEEPRSRCQPAYSKAASHFPSLP